MILIIKQIVIVHIFFNFFNLSLEVSFAKINTLVLCKDFWYKQVVGKKKLECIYNEQVGSISANVSVGIK